MRKQRPSLLATFLSRLTKGGAAAPAPVTASANKFQAIAIFRGSRACDMAKRFSEHRFLVKDAPALPLKNCTMPLNCECKYLKFKDRRSEPRRVIDFGSTTRVYGYSDRRTHKGRRHTD
jgi:hypothetical protein